ncbi:hypothetical protein RchiOBHm_Chr7g0229961 [Rosa chinensis]|uniref:Uncharacterized protein n=1 Tax=Rosa chinensis TaxID=74649 RepID=A0A2P6PF95_ROSCH|nr:hypothetical protein RchiOBHm_Chr7g0229961 [Rosa chinensis]
MLGDVVVWCAGQKAKANKGFLFLKENRNHGALPLVVHFQLIFYSHSHSLFRLCLLQFSHHPHLSFFFFQSCCNCNCNSTMPPPPPPVETRLRHRPKPSLGVTKHGLRPSYAAPMAVKPLFLPSFRFPAAICTHIHSCFTQRTNLVAFTSNQHRLIAAGASSET